MAAIISASHPVSLAERSLPRQAHARRYRRSELSDLGGPRRSQSAPDVPGVGPHLAGVQPLARVAVAVRLEGRAMAYDAWRQSGIRSAVHLLLQQAAGRLGTLD